jgi:hypothetical protein
MWIDGLVLLKGAGFTKTVHERGISLSGTRREQGEGFHAGKKHFLLHIFLLIYTSSKTNVNDIHPELPNW